MATVGTFKTTGNNEFNGEIVTLSLQPRNVRIVPETSRSGDNAPSHRIYVGRVEIGAAWTKRSNEGRDYLGLKLDDPSFTAPIFANLFAEPSQRRLTRPKCLARLAPAGHHLAQEPAAILRQRRTTTMRASRVDALIPSRSFSRKQPRACRRA